MATVFSRENHLQLGWDIPQYYAEATAQGEGRCNHLSRKEAPGSKLFEREEGLKKKKKSAFTYLQAGFSKLKLTDKPDPVQYKHE